MKKLFLLLSTAFILVSCNQKPQQECNCQKQIDSLKILIKDYREESIKNDLELSEMDKIILDLF